MNEKIYCSQCHNSVFRINRNTDGSPRVSSNARNCLYCYKRKRHLPADREINGCTSLEPEDRQKLLRQFWNANVANRDAPQ